MTTLLPASRPSIPSKSLVCIFQIDNSPYRVEPLRADPTVAAKAYLFTKPDGESYHIRLTAHGPECECLGFLRWGHCKHIQTLKTFGCF